MTTFTDLGADDTLIKALTDAFYITEPMPIQVQAWPVLASGRSAVITERTGGGKTLAYLLPLLSRIDLRRAANQLLIVTPTQELALQIGQVVTTLATHLSDLRAETAIGGANIRYQIDRLKSKPPIVIGTPGRLLELFDRRKINGKTITAVFFDEIDELLSDGGKGVSYLQKALLRDVQQVAVSASPREKTRRFFANAGVNMVHIGTEDTALNPNIEHFRLATGEDRKGDSLRHLLHALADAGRTLVFLNRPDQIDRTAARLQHHGLPVVALHADMNKLARSEAMQAFRTGTASILVTSDVGARGLDFPDVHQVVHLDFPHDPLTYVHRAGRTARGEAVGSSIVIADEKDNAPLRIYARELGIGFIDMHVADGLCYRGLDPKKNRNGKGKSGKKKTSDSRHKTARRGKKQEKRS